MSVLHCFACLHLLRLEEVCTAGYGPPGILVPSVHGGLVGLSWCRRPGVLVSPTGVIASFIGGGTDYH